MGNITINKKDLCSRQKVAKKYTTHLKSETLVLSYVNKKATSIYYPMLLAGVVGFIVSNHLEFLLKK